MEASPPGQPSSTPKEFTHRPFSASAFPTGKEAVLLYPFTGYLELAKRRFQRFSSLDTRMKTEAGGFKRKSAP
jgi:hypothetical protein